MAGYTQERRKQLVVNKNMQSRLILNMALLPAFALAGTIGNYDGVHLGHREILRGTVGVARRRGLRSC